MPRPTLHFLPRALPCCPLTRRSPRTPAGPIELGATWVRDCPVHRTRWRATVVSMRRLDGGLTVEWAEVPVRRRKAAAA